MVINKISNGMNNLSKKLLIGALSLVVLAVIAGTVFYYNANNFIDITYQLSPEVGEEIVVKFPSLISENIAKKSFSIAPPIEGQLIWNKDFNELHFVPHIGFQELTSYDVEIKLSIPLLATPLPATKNISIEIDTAEPLQNKNIIQQPAITEGKYVDVNLETMIFTLFEDGKVIKTFPVAGKGNPNRSPTIEGTFKILNKEDNHFSSLSHVWMPYSMQFFGDYFIHEWPYWPDGKKIETEYSAGCIRLYESDAKEVYDWAEIRTPIIVHSTSKTVSIVSPETIRDGDLVRELSDYRVYIVKHIGEKLFKRHVLTEKIDQWYQHLYPFKSKVKIIPDGTLAKYATSRWVRLFQLDESEIYEIDDQGIKHKMICDNQDCNTVWGVYGWDSDEIYTVATAELNYYPSGSNYKLIPSTLISK